MTEWLTIPQAAERYGYTPTALYHQIYARQIKWRRERGYLNKLVYVVSAESVEAWAKREAHYPHAKIRYAAAWIDQYGRDIRTRKEAHERFMRETGIELSETHFFNAAQTVGVLWRKYPTRQLRKALRTHSELLMADKQTALRLLEELGIEISYPEFRRIRYAYIKELRKGE